MHSPCSVRQTSSASKRRRERDADRGRHEQQAREPDRARTPDPVGDRPPHESPDRDRQHDERDREPGPRRADVEVARELGQDRLRRVHRREHPGRSEHEAGESLLQRIGGAHPGQATQPGYRARIGMAHANVASSPYAAVEQKLAEDRCVVLDGGVATELQRMLPAGTLPREGDLWGTWPLYRAPETVLDVHRAYVAAGCDVISTDTWSVLTETDGSGEAKSGLLHWMDIARTGIRLARTAAAEDTDRPRAVAFSVSDEAESLGRAGTARLLARIFEDEPPDLILLETLSLIREPDTFDLVSSLVELGLPLWLSYRRCRHGVCGVYGQHWGPPEGDLFGRAATRFEEMGVAALLINCLPVDHVPGMSSWLRDFTDMPLGVYPNLGHLTRGLWRFDDRIDPEAYARLALEWREEGAQIIGGCCGVTPEHIAAAAAALEGTQRRHRRVAPRADTADGAPPAAVDAWRDERGAHDLSAPVPRSRRRAGRLRSDAGELPALEAPATHRARSRRHVPRRRLRLRDPRRPAGAQRRRRRSTRSTSTAARSRNTLANAFRNDVAAARHRRDDRPLPVGADGRGST